MISIKKYLLNHEKSSPGNEFGENQKFLFFMKPKTGSFPNAKS